MNGVWHFTKLIRVDTLKNQFVPVLNVNFLKKLPQLVAFQIFQSSYINHEESLSHNILLHNYQINIEQIIRSIIYITKKTTKFGSQNFGYQIWFCTRLFTNMV